MEIEFVKRVAETWPTLSPEMVPDGRKVVRTKRKTLKKLAKENEKVSNWLISKTSDMEENNPDLDIEELREMEIEIELESNQPSNKVLERRLKRDEQMESWWSTKMCREIVLGLIRDVPGSALLDEILNRVAIKKECQQKTG